MIDKCEYYITEIENNIHRLVAIQEKCNEIYESMNCENYTGQYNQLSDELYSEKQILDILLCNLNKLFSIEPKWYRPFHDFKLREDGMLGDRYIISPPLFLDKTSREYITLTKLLMRLHKHYFLDDGGIGYAFSSVESHKWEIPCFVNENYLVHKLRKSIK